jgi:hypothetical protein
MLNNVLGKNDEEGYILVTRKYKSGNKTINVASLNTKSNVNGEGDRRCFAGDALHHKSKTMSN